VLGVDHPPPLVDQEQGAVPDRAAALEQDTVAPLDPQRLDRRRGQGGDVRAVCDASF
jgi:hypothetical protein